MHAREHTREHLCYPISLPGVTSPTFNSVYTLSDIFLKLAHKETHNYIFIFTQLL